MGNAFAAGAVSSGVSYTTCAGFGWLANQNYQPYTIPTFQSGGNTVPLCRAADPASASQHEPDCAATPPDNTYFRLCWCTVVDGNRRRMAQSTTPEWTVRDVEARTSGGCDEPVTIAQCQRLARDKELQHETSQSTPRGCYSHLGKWTYNSYDPSTKAHVFACSALRKCYCREAMPPNPPPPTDTKTRRLSNKDYIDEPDMSDLMGATVEPSVPFEVEPIDWTNRTPVDQKVVAALTVLGWPDLDEHFGPLSRPPNHTYRRRALSVVDRDRRL